MKKIMIAGAVLAMMCGSAMAQNSTGPAPQSDNIQKPGSSAPDRGSMNHGTTGVNNDMTRGGVRPDASGQGGSGPGSDQGGTRAVPSNTK
jgi:hypothetical protein